MPSSQNRLKRMTLKTCIAILLSATMVASRHNTTDSCSSGDLKCCNGKCVNDGWIRDGENDCGDNSDETNPAFQCSSTDTIPGDTIPGDTIPGDMGNNDDMMGNMGNDDYMMRSIGALKAGDEEAKAIIVDAAPATPTSNTQATSTEVARTIFEGIIAACCLFAVYIVATRKTLPASKDQIDAPAAEISEI